MALSEATALADKFITSMLFRVHILPLYERSKRAARWLRAQGSSLRVGEALDEERRHLGHFSVRDTIDKSMGRSRHLTISALTVDREKGRCPALTDAICGIYDSRPLACRTVPMHYSMPFSVLGSYLDKFVRTPGYLCDTTTKAPVVLNGGGITDSLVQQARDDALELAESEQGWKSALVSLMDNPEAALAAGLPTYEAVLRNSDAGSATAVPMLVAWRVARNVGVLSPQSFEEICQKQISLIKSELARGPDLALARSLAGALSDYQLELTS